MNAVLAVDGIVKHFGSVKAVDGLSFEARPGSITGLLGRNGAGKTTTLRMITGVFLPDSGTVTLFGQPGGVFRDRIGYLPEERGLYRKMKVLEQLLFLAEIKGKPPRQVRAAALTWLERFELADKRDTKLEELSKGNQQKIQLIGALLFDPDLVILDEPMSGLDPVNVVLVRQLLVELKTSGKAILLSTHMMGEAEKLCEEIVLIHGGKAVVKGPLGAVKAASGINSVLLGFEGDGSFLAELPRVVRASVDTNRAELRLEPDADPQEVLVAALGRLKILKFEVVTPSLEEIFIEAVGGETLGHGVEVRA